MQSANTSGHVSLHATDSPHVYASMTVVIRFVDHIYSTVLSDNRFLLDLNCNNEL